jgi:hypothetical protein
MEAQGHEDAKRKLTTAHEMNILTNEQLQGKA